MIDAGQALMIGKKVLRYQIIGKLGAGGMGVVWKALDPQLDREVALKILPEGAAAEPHARERFIREAKSASALNHPNIVTIYEINSDGDMLFIAMELIRGKSLAAMLRGNHALRPGVALKYARQVAEGMALAHRAGIVHRDLKPSNIMVTDDGLVKVLDFGLAKLAAPRFRAEAGSDTGDETTLGREELTRPGAIVGTVPYMSPEQVAGDATDLRSDVFSMGVVFYEMLGGHRPFGGASNADVIRAVMVADPPALETLAPGVPEELVGIVNRCLQKKPGDRYQSAEEVAVALRNPEFFSAATATLGATPKPLTPAPIQPPTATLTAETRGPAAKWTWLAALALLVAGGLGIYALRPGRVPVGNAAAAGDVTPVEALDRARAFLLRYDRKGNIDRAVATLEPVLRQNPKNAALQAALSEAWVRRYGATTDKMWLQKAVEAGRLAVAANEDLAAAHVALGVALAADGKSDLSQTEFEKARDLDPLNGAALVGFAKLRAARPEGSQEAGDLFAKAVELSPGDWRPLAEQAIFYYRNARYDDAIGAWKRVLQLAPDNSRQLVNLAAAYHSSNHFAEAADTLQRALEIDPIAGTWTNLGTARFFQGRYADAVKAMEKAVELAPGNFLYWGNLGDVYRWAPGEMEKAAGAYAKAIGLVREKLALNAQDTNARGSLAVYLAKSGDTADALKEIAALGQAAEKDPGAAFKSVLVYELAHDRKQALAALDKALRAGYSKHEIAMEPDLAELRKDAGYGRLAGSAGGR